MTNIEQKESSGIPQFHSTTVAIFSMHYYSLGLLEDGGMISHSRRELGKVFTMQNLPTQKEISNTIVIKRNRPN